MDFSSTNTAIWNPVIQIGVIAALILLANVLRRKFKIVQRSLLPTAVLAGFILLGIKVSGILPIDTKFLETLTYHALALGFICMSLRIPDKNSDSGALIGSKSGALIVSTYLVQAIAGLVVSLGLAYTVTPKFFKAAGILLPMAYGQGPGQANNVGATYQSLGMESGRTFGLSLAAAGYLCACVVGVVFLNMYNKKNKIERIKEKDDISGSVTIDTFQNSNEIPISESIDKLSIQFALVAMLYLLTYWVTRGLCSLITTIVPVAAATVSSLLWGFNFIIGSMVATVCRTVMKHLRTRNIMSYQYQNNYLLSRMSGLAFDLMIVAGVASIDISDLTGFWVPFILMAVVGAIVTYFYLMFMCKKIYPDYAYEGFFSMYGMLTGTLSSGVLLLREIDPDFETPAANNLVTGSSFGIVFGAPVLLLVSFAPQDPWLTLLLVCVYLIILLAFIFGIGKKNGQPK